MMERKSEEEFILVGRAVIHVNRAFRSVVFMFSILLCTAGITQVRRDAVLDTLDARHDKSKSLLERLDIMSKHDEALFAQGRYEERDVNTKEYLELAQQVGTDSIMSKAYGMIAGNSRSGGRTSTTLKYYLLARKHALAAGDGRQLSFVEKEIGILYKDMKDYPTAMQYLKRAQLVESDPGQVNRISCHLGEIMLALGKPDSALYYAQRSNVFINPDDDPYGYARSQLVLGTAYAALGQQDQSAAFLRRCVSICDSLDVVLPMTQALTAQARALIAVGRPSEAITIGKRSMAVARRAYGLGNDIEAADILWKAYRAAGNSDSALVYSVLVSHLKDSLTLMSDRSNMQDLIFDQQLKDREEAKLKEEAAISRANNIQFGIIALIVITLAIFLLIFSRTAVVGAKAIKNLSLIALLLFFEFINLLLHPVLDRVTGHSPLLMILIMVGIAGLLIPLHHRMERWITNMLVSKNNRVRLQAARRTIEELEGRA
jgi:tetratricopeptide (TPR) repeat protein